MYFERVIFSDGYYIDRKEVVEWYKSVQDDPLFDMAQVNIEFVCDCLDFLRGLSKFYKMETIRSYFDCLLRQPLEGKLSDLHDTLSCFHVSEKRKVQIEWIINNFCHEIDKTNENMNSDTRNSDNKAMSKIEFLDGFYINRDEALKYYADHNSGKKGSREINFYLNSLEKLSEFFTMSTINEYLESINQDKENMSNIDYAFYDLNISGKGKAGIRDMIKVLAHKDNKTNITPSDCGYDDSYRKFDDEQIQLSDGVILCQDIYDDFRKNGKSIVLATNYINTIKRFVSYYNTTLEDLRSNMELPCLCGNTKIATIRELAIKFGRDINMNGDLSGLREEILNLQEEMGILNKKMKELNKEIERYNRRNARTSRNMISKISHILRK